MTVSVIVSATLKQSELREILREAVAEKLDSLDFFDLADAVIGEWDNDALDKAFNDVYYGVDNALKKVSRLAVRLGYLDKETNA